MNIMGLFNTSKYRNIKNIRQGSSKPDIFKQRGGKLYKRRVDRRINRLPITRTQKEYVKQVMSKYDRPGSRGVTREEFLSGLDEMAKNTKDSIKQSEIKRIKEHF